MLVWKEFEKGWQVVDLDTNVIKKVIFDSEVNDRINEYFESNNIFDTTFANFLLDIKYDIECHNNMADMCEYGCSYQFYKWLKGKCFVRYQRIMLNKYLESESA
jgi:hypothetical protein